MMSVYRSIPVTGDIPWGFWQVLGMCSFAEHQHLRGDSQGCPMRHAQNTLPKTDLEAENGDLEIPIGKPIILRGDLLVLGSVVTR